MANRKKSQRKSVNIDTVITNPFPDMEDIIVEEGPGGFDQPTPNNDENDIAILYELWSSGMQPENRPSTFHQFLTKPGRFHWWPNGRLAGANLQWSNSDNSTTSGLFAINQLPNNCSPLSVKMDSG